LPNFLVVDTFTSYNNWKMENQEINRSPQRRGKKVVGIAILLVGLVLLAKQLGILIPNWIISWPMLLIAIGIANGFKHQFKNSAWIILILIGSVFLVEKIFPMLSVAHFTWPVILIGIGIWFIFGRRSQYDFKRRDKWRNFNGFNKEETNYTQTEKNNDPVTEEKQYRSSGDEFIDTVSVFGGTKKSVLNKNFKGGDVVSIFGGTEINLTHADINGTVVLDVIQMFGGTKIIVPPAWDVKSEMAAIFGGIDDKRALSQVLTDGSKVLLIKGTSIFGGIDIRNF
jgi:predicted membrane protein